MNEQQFAQMRQVLWSINKLGLKKVVSRLQQLLKYNIPAMISPLLRQCIKTAKKEPILIKYLQLIDLLLHNHVFNNILQGCLLEFYPSIVKYLSKSKYQTLVQEAKVIRKLWVRKIHPQLYGKLREEVLKIVNVDVEVIHDKALIEKVRGYYQVVLKMTQQQIKEYMTPPQHKLNKNQQSEIKLPRKTKIEAEQAPQVTPEIPKPKVAPQVPKPKVTSQVLTQVAPSAPKPKVAPQAPKPQVAPQVTKAVEKEVCQFNNNYLWMTTGRRFGRPIFQQQIQFLKGHKRIKTILKSDMIIHINQQNPADIYTSIQGYDYGKRERFPQEEANSQDSLSFTSTIAKRQPLKYVLPERVPVVIEGVDQMRKMRAQMNSLFNAQCKQCGMKFMTDNARRRHMEEHIKQKLEAMDQKLVQEVKRPKVSHYGLMTQQQFIGVKSSEERDKDNAAFYVSADVIKDPIGFCSLCGDKFEYQFIDEQWRIMDAIIRQKKEANGEKKQEVMHARCGNMLFCKS